jgi:hypothetical protein
LTKTEIDHHRSLDLHPVLHQHLYASAKMISGEKQCIFTWKIGKGECAVVELF